MLIYSNVFLIRWIKNYCTVLHEFEFVDWHFDTVFNIIYSYSRIRECNFDSLTGLNYHSLVTKRPNYIHLSEFEMSINESICKIISAAICAAILNVDNGFIFRDLENPTVHS